MNNLSWFLYLIDVLQNVNLVIIIVAWGSIGSILLRLIGFAVGANENMFEEPLLEWKKVLNYTYKAIFTSIIIFIVASFIPSRDTMYAIAASQSIEYVAKTPEGTKAREILDKALDKLSTALDKETSASSSSSSESK